MHKRNVNKKQYYLFLLLLAGTLLMFIPFLAGL